MGLVVGMHRFCHNECFFYTQAMHGFDRRIALSVFFITLNVFLYIGHGFGQSGFSVLLKIMCCLRGVYY